MKGFSVSGEGTLVCLQSLPQFHVLALLDYLLPSKAV